MKPSKLFILSLDKDDDLTIQKASQGFEKLIGISLDKDKVSYAKLISPEELSSYKLNLKKAVESGKNEAINELYSVITNDNKLKYFYDQIQVMRDDNGKVTHYQVSIFDLTEIYLQKNRLQLVLEGSGLGLWDWNPQTNEVTFDKNWANMLGYELEEIEFNLSSWESRVHPDDLASCYDDIKAHMEGKVDLYQNVHRMKHKNGDWVYIWDRGKIVERDPAGNPVRFTGTHLDISEQKTAEEKLIKEIKSKESFFALMSHEIRTPINIILGATEAILINNKVDGEDKKFIQYIENSSSLLLNIINDILEYSKMQSTKITFNNENFNLLANIKKLMKTFVPLLDKKDNKLKLNIINAEVDFNIYSDPGRINQVLTNLISNANKFSSQSDIEINLKIQDDIISIEIKDYGIGIDKNNIEKLFVPYIQEESTTSQHFGGTGLGLAISKNIVEALDGEISVSSEKGKGATFTFTIPFTKPSSSKLKDKDQKTTQNGLTGKSILVVEDNIMAQEFMKKFLNFENCEVTVAGDGEEAVSLCQKRKFDIVLMDMYLPKINGVEATKMISEDQSIQPKPIIIALTANLLDLNKKRCLEAGMVDFISKPIKQEEIRKVLLKNINKQSN
ncbi:MAG: PAS domain-containing hybrid sensor histidine kinase/response regulator [Bacteriovoracaceae bacterium]